MTWGTRPKNLVLLVVVAVCSNAEPVEQKTPGVLDWREREQPIFLLKNVSYQQM